jgi:hypothetical protein
MLLPCAQEDLDYYMFWATVFHSKLPYFKAQAAFIHNTIRISVWKVGWQTDTSIQVIKCISASCRVIDSTFQLDTVVAPRMPLPRLSPELQLRPSEKSSLVTAVGDAEMFKVGAHNASWASISAVPQKDVHAMLAGLSVQGQLHFQAGHYWPVVPPTFTQLSAL